LTPRLTIVLPLKGRDLFTLRFLWHANRARLPYRIVIADGLVNPPLAEILEHSRDHFPDIDLEYIRYPDDDDFTRYFTKLLDAIGRVRTPYVMLADNDDFPMHGGIEGSLDFLDNNADYVCCGGGLAGFAVYAGLRDSRGGLSGRLNRFTYRYTVFDRSDDFDSDSVAERLRRGSRNWWSFYAVFRQPELATIFREVVEIDFSDLQLYELFCSMRTLTLGKARSDGSTIAYLRQYGTSQRSSFKQDWVYHLLRSRFTSDFEAMIDRISHAAGRKDGVPAEPIAEELRAICADWLREFLRVNYGSLQTVKQMMRNRTPGLVNWLLKRRRYSVGRERAALLTKLKADGASDRYLGQFEIELAAVEDVLSGPDFAKFVEPHVPALLPRAGR
jgi:glycosyltransferase domain-containing protein